MKGWYAKILYGVRFRPQLLHGSNLPTVPLQIGLRVFSSTVAPILGTAALRGRFLEYHGTES
ncbi:hypothetical protein L484_015843 [Morus notabilis]|uniref:Uncharacterized protein n=1 Tax=Morus notabilis TaxID=981085 RepID=W9RDY8_9ROSA|nr:hypothetical protein L484_015843 [Morus notabilis]